MTAQIQKQEVEFPDTPTGWGQRWKMEIDWAKKALEDWHKEGDEAVRRFRDDRSVKSEVTNATRLPIYTQSVKALEAHLLGKTPKVQASRRHADAADDAARVAAEMLERHLNTDIEDDDDSFQDALSNAVKDYVRPALGCIRVLYTVKGEPLLGEDGEPVVGDDGEPQEKKAYECAETRYVHWKDFLWSPCKVWSEVRWVAEALYFTRKDLIDEFGKDIGNVVPLDAGKPSDDEQEKASPWARARIWEVWDKATKKVFWISESYPVPLRTNDDPLKLKRFLPYPRPMMGNLATDKLVPKPDYCYARDLLDEIDLVESKIKALTDALRVIGFYDATQPEIKQALEKGVQNRMYPVANWAALTEQGGIRGAVDWMPLEMIVGTLDKLREVRIDLRRDADQMIGTGDLQQPASGGNTAREALIQHTNSNKRVQSMETEVARFATDVQLLKREIIAKHYSPETLVQKANMMATADREKVPEAVQLIQSQWAEYRVEVKPEALNQTDFATLRSEGVEVIQGLSAFLQAAAPLAQSMPGSTPLLMELLGWWLARFRGASSMEGIIDQAIQQAQQGPPPGQDKPDPKMQAAQLKAQSDQMKAQADIQKEVVKGQIDLTRIAAEGKAAEKNQASEAFWNTQEEIAKAEIKAKMIRDNPLAGLGSKS